MELMTVKDIMSATGKAERTVRDMVRRDEIQWSGESRGREKLYYWPPTQEAPKMTASAPVGETYNQLRTLAESGEITMEQALRLADTADAMRRARGLDKKVLDKEAAELDARAKELSEKEKWLAGGAAELEAEKKKQSESWKADTEVLEELKSSLEEEEVFLKTLAERIDLVRKWCGVTVNALTTSETWGEAYYAEKSELPEWPEDVRVDEVVGWMELEIPKKKGGRKS